MNRYTMLLLMSGLALGAMAQSVESHPASHNMNHMEMPDMEMPADSLMYGELSDTLNLQEVVVAKRRAGVMKLSGPENSVKLTQTEFFKAACCNLGESFTTNPSVDVNYADPATGAKQIKLLGLDGSYVQLLNENISNFRGASRPYALRYVPGPWMKSISISKGASSVKNGFESMSGQINVDYLKPDDPQGATLNAYFDTDAKMEYNVEANKIFNNKLSSQIMAHYEDRLMNHDGNGDGFVDTPDIRQINLKNRWKYASDKYMLNAGIGVLNEKSRAGQLGHHSSMMNPYIIDLNTQRYEAFSKHAFVLNHEKNTNIAFIANGSYHDMDATYGKKLYDVKEWNGAGQVIFETNFDDKNSLSTGLSYNYDSFDQKLRRQQDSSLTPEKIFDKEHTAGGYAQYTFKHSDKLTAMAGLRGDWSSRYGWFATPRLNVRYSPVYGLNIRGSVGKGYRTVNPWAEYNYLMASGRELYVENLNQEAAWNYGVNADYKIYMGTHSLKLNADYYFTNFDRQVIIDYDTNPHALTIANLKGKSYSHTFQVDATYESPFGLTATAAYRFNDVKTTYGGKLLEKPLTSKYKALLSLSYATPMKIWQFDATLALNGGGRLPAPYQLADGSYSWGERFKAFPQLNLQATKWFRTFSVYVGGENLTNFRQKNPIVWSQDPWNSKFDSTMTWGPTHGAMGYVGVRFNFGKQ